MTFLEIQTFCKANYRLASSDLDTLLKSQINFAYRMLARKGWWPGLMVHSATLTTTTAQSYALPDTFEQLFPNSVRYDVTATSPTVPGSIIPDVPYQQFVLYQGLPESLVPQACCIQSSGTATVMALAPVFTQTGKTIYYSYRRTPAELSADGDIPAEISLCEALAFKALAMMANYHGKPDDAAGFERSARMAVSGAIMSTPQGMT